MRKGVRYGVVVSAVMLLTAAAGAQTTVRKIDQFRLGSDFTEIVHGEPDTLFSLYHRYRRTDRYSPFNAYAGNYGLPVYQIGYFDRIRSHDSYLYQFYYPFMYLPSTALFMDTQVPFTEMVFNYAGATRATAEQNFRVRHSQNLTPNLNIGLIYDIVYSLGQYSYQKAENKDFILHSSYQREKYRIFGALGINNLYSNENGGVVDPETIGQFETTEVPVRLGGLNRAKSTLLNRNLLLVQHYSPTGFRESSVADTTKGGLLGRFTHTLTWEANRRTYFDARPRSGFYDTAWLFTPETRDSLSSLLFTNTLRFDFGFRTKAGFELMAGGGIRHELHRYRQIVPLFPADTVIADTSSTGHQNLALTGSLENRVGRNFRWDATGLLYFTGDRAGDFDLKGNIRKDFDMPKGKSGFIIDGRVSLETPSLWFRQWGSNNFIWNRGAGDREFTISAGVSYSYPGRYFETSFRYAVIENFMYFGSDALPAVKEGALSVAAAEADKTFRLGNFRLGATVLAQQSSNREVLDLPLLTFRTALWFDRNFHFRITGGNLHIETGAELFMHTRYNAMAYMPATGRYYNQNTTAIGEYPFVNVFLNAKIKRTRILLSFDHVNSGLTGAEYFLIPRNPMNVRVFRYGVAWTFYD